MSSQEIRNIINLMEARQPSADISYTDTETSATAKLKGKKSSEFTRLATQYDEIMEIERGIKSEKRRISEKLKSSVKDLFDAEDALKTKYVETVSAAISVKKDVEARDEETFDLDGFFEEVYDLLDKEIVSKLLEIREKYINIRKVGAREGGIGTVKIKESIIKESFLSNLKDWASDFANRITRRLPIVDKRFNKIKRKYGVA